MKFNIGDTVYFYSSSGRRCAYVIDGTKSNQRPICSDCIFVEYDCSGDIVKTWVHPKQCRKIKQKEKQVKITMKNLFKAMHFAAYSTESSAGTNSNMIRFKDVNFQMLCDRLGL